MDRSARSSGGVRPPRLGYQTGGGDAAPGCARRRSRQAETLALDRGGGRPWNCPCGGRSRNPDASKAAGPRHQAPRRDAATRFARALGEDCRAGAGKPTGPGCALICRERAASGPTGSGRDASNPGARSAERARHARAVGRPGRDAGRLSGQPAKTGRELGLDSVVPNSAGARTSRGRSR